MNAEITDAEIVDPEPVEAGTELATVTPAGNLFRSDDPSEVIERATNVANVLKGVMDKQGLTSSIQGKKHVLVEGWTTCGAMLGVVPVVEWTRKTDNGWEARVEARTMDGRVVGAAEASCTRDEKRWKSADDYAVRSMAQTRATSKALRGPLGFIVTLAGFNPTPAEEMPSDPAVAPPLAQPFDKSLKTVVGKACTALAGGQPALGKALFESIMADCGGVFPQAAALAVINCAGVQPDIEPPEL